MKTLIMFIFLALMMILFYYTLIWAADAIISIDNEAKEKIGQQVILNKDTLIIINYSLWDDTYTLENGIIISKEFLNLKPKP